ncbi:hypothetical protein N7466_003437 [Penicillium verhagenii]|uniref:uncharacterized protein n=1 Tax=Penicillium verhagenii TaxID=1562060 RepID=UPI002544ED43|nr:uncharacterized protein N7466_003437 [Penicillium verhagenii]KAJ5936987.1 hypothetical protein N7466_003437 [Penicillium verhagenii]
MRPRGANGESGIARAPDQAKAAQKPKTCAPHQDTGRLGTRAIVAPVVWEMMVSQTRAHFTFPERLRLPIGRWEKNIEKEIKMKR